MLGYMETKNWELIRLQMAANQITFKWLSWIIQVGLMYRNLKDSLTIKKCQSVGGEED